MFRIEAVELEFQNGVKTAFERLYSQADGAVMIVPLLMDTTILLIREYAVGTQRYKLALSQGRIEQGEDWLKAANRELMEEVGDGVRRLTRIIYLILAPGYSGARTHVVLAEDLFAERRPSDAPEEVEVISWRLDRLEELIGREDFTEVRSIAALYSARDMAHS